MASVKPRGANRWLLVWRATDPATGQTAQRSKMFEGSRSDAVRAANEIEGSQRREPVQSTHGITFGKYLTDWQGWRAEAGNVTTKTSYRDGQHIKVITDLIGSRPLARLTGRDLDQLAADLHQRGYAPITVHNTWACAKKALRQARRWRLIASTPWEDATVPPVPQASPQPPSVAETQHLADLLVPHQPVAAILLHTMLATGARKSELLALSWDDVDLERGAISIHKAVWEAGGVFGLKQQPKNAASRRSIALPADAVTRLKAHRTWIRERQLASGRAWNADDLVFPAAGGGLWRPSRATAVVGHVARKNGLKTGLHNRRHTHAVPLMQSQVPIKVVANRLGHADPAMTLKVYQHVTEEAAQLAVQALDRALSSPSPDAGKPSTINSDTTAVVDSAVDSAPGAARNKTKRRPVTR
jgi:integrase